MATTTTNYGWTVPTSSDLVKNGATAISTVGSSVDTALWNSGFGQAGKNKIINGNFSVWQRGTSFTTNNAFGADRFFSTWDGTGTFTTSQQSFTAGTAPVSGYEGQYFQRIALNTTGTSTYYQTATRVEDVRNFAGQTVTFSFWAKANTATTITNYIEQYYGSGGSGTTGPSSTTYSVTTSWQRFSYTFAMPSVSGKTINAGNYIQFTLRSFSIASGATLDIWGVQAEVGSVPTPFQTASGGSPQAELAMCQRYYYRTSSAANSNPVYSLFGVGYAISVNAMALSVNFPVSMRVAPTALDTSATSTFYWEGGSTGNTPTTVAIGGSSQNNLGQVTLSKTASFVANATYWVFSNNTQTAYLGFSAEL